MLTSNLPETPDPPLIIVVDADPLVRWALGEILQRAGGQVIPAASGVDAADRLAAALRPGPGVTRIPRVAIVDDDTWPIPWSAAPWLRRRWHGLPLVALVCPARPGRGADGLRALVQASFVKPFSVTEAASTCLMLARHAVRT